MKKRMVLSLLLIFIVAVLALGGYSKYVIDVKGLDMYDVENFIAYSDYVFIGEVVEIGETASVNSQPTNIPYTDMIINVEENLKGTLKNEIKLKKIGGTNKKTKMKYIIKSNGKKDLFPEVGKKYIFIACCEQDGTILSQFDGCLFFTEENYNTVKKSIEKNVDFIKERYTSSYELY